MIIARSGRDRLFEALLIASRAVPGSRHLHGDGTCRVSSVDLMAAPIEHMVVLMLENRSFDSMLGWLYPDRPDFDGLTGRETNPWHRDGGVVTVPVWNDLGMSRTEARGPDPDPGELFDDIEAQLWGADSVAINGHGQGTPISFRSALIPIRLKIDT